MKKARQRLTRQRALDESAKKCRLLTPPQARPAAVMMVMQPVCEQRHESNDHTQSSENCQMRTPGRAGR